MMQNPRMAVINSLLDGIHNLDPIAQQAARKMANNIYSMPGRGVDFGGNSMEPDARRDIYDECGFPRTVKPELYQDLYEREAIAARVVEVLAKESWQVSPELYEAERGQIQTPFETAWDELAKRLEQSSDHNWHEQEQSTTIWADLMRADILSGIGRYGVILLGLDDGQELNTPVKGIVENGSIENDKPGQVSAPKAYQLTANQGAKATRQLLYIRPFPEVQAQITRWESNPASPRFGQPVAYQIDFARSKDQYGVGQPLSTKTVHWTRIIHLADTYHTACPNEILAAPRQQPVLNHLLNLRKIYHPSAEGYWKSVFAILALSTHPQLGGEVDVDEDVMRDVMEHVFQGLQRYMLLRGMDAKNIAPAMTDPSPYIDSQIEAICIKLDCPVRVFRGSERGELASSQDEREWNEGLRDRQKKYTSPKVISRFANHMIFLGVLPEPSRFVIYWPDVATQTDQEKANVGETLTRAIVQYASSDAPMAIQLFDYLTRILKMSDEEAEVIVQNSKAAMEEANLEGEGEEDDDEDEEEEESGDGEEEDGQE